MHLRALYALICLLVLPASAQFQGAREKLDDYRASQARVDAAYGAGNSEAAQSELRRQGEIILEARRQFEEGRVLERGTPEDLAVYAEVLAVLGDFDIAAEALKEAIRQVPSAGKHWVALGSMLSRVGPATVDEAFEVLQRASKMNLEDADAANAFFQLGKLYHQQGLADFAAEQYGKALERVPDHVQATLGSAALRVRRGEVAEASEMIDRLGRAAQPYDAETRIMLRHALTDYSEFGAPFADTYENHVAYSRLLYRAGRLPDATLAGQRAMVLNPQAFETLNFLATIYFQTGNLEFARQSLEQSLKVNPNQPQVQEGLKSLPPPEVVPPPMLQRPTESPAAAPAPVETPAPAAE